MHCSALVFFCRRAGGGQESDPFVPWNPIPFFPPTPSRAGQEVAKNLIQEVVVWPLLNPHIFTVGLGLGGFTA